MIDHNNWYQYFFDGLALDLWDRVVSSEYTDQEVKFITEVIPLPPGTRVLDMPCGSGRHSVALARAGYELTSIDISKTYMDRLKEKVSQESLPIRVIEMDMLKYNAEEKNDVVLCLGNSFSYFNRDKMSTFLGVLSNSVKKEGYVLVNTGSLAESVLPNRQENSWMQVGDLYFLMAHEYDSSLGALRTNMQFIEGNRIEKKTAYHFYYTLAEVNKMCESQGLKVKTVFAGLDGKIFQFGNPQAYILMQRI